MYITNNTHDMKQDCNNFIKSLTFDFKLNGIAIHGVYAYTSFIEWS